jgi:hypothetical protein
MKKTMNSLAALAAAAAPLAGQAEPVPTEQAVSYRFSQYQEADIPESRTFSNETARYSIDIHQLGYRRPLAGQWYLNSELQYETMSGASPMQTYKNSEGQSAVLMSGASIDESRIDLKLTPTRYFEESVDGTLGGLLAISTENDYDSVAVGAEGSLNLMNKHTTLMGSLTLSYDVLAPTDEFLSEARRRADGRVKRSVSLYEGVSQVINKNLALQIGVGFTRLFGYLSDPYKLDDNRPDDRSQYLLDAKMRHYFSIGSGAALHFDYRFYIDSWGIYSNTLETRWAQALNAGRFNFKLIPSLRYYRQTQASFYRLTPAEAGEYSSSDYRLSSYGAFNIGLAASASCGRWQISGDVQQYMSSENMMLLQTPDDEAPALVDYSIVSLGIEYKTL